MGRKDESRASLLTCGEVRDRVYPLLLRTLEEKARLDTLEHVNGCESCRAALHIARGRLTRLGGVSLPDFDEQRRERARRRRVWITVLPLALVALLAYALLILQVTQVARYRAEWKFMTRLQNALLRYRADFGEFPPSNKAPLSVYLSTREKRGPYLDLSKERMDPAGHFLDRWGHRYRYEAPGIRNPWLFDLQSLGANGSDEQGRRDDVANWD
jgi:hypothetical protein